MGREQISLKLKDNQLSTDLHLPDYRKPLTKEDK